MNLPSTQFPHLVIPRAEHSISRAAISPNALKVLYRLKEAGYEAFLVGGAVRDLLLGDHAEGFRRGHRRVAGRRAAAVSKLPAHRPPLSPGSRAFRQRDHRSGDFPCRRGAGARGCGGFGRRCRGGPIVEASEHRAFDTTGRILRDNIYGTIEEDVWRRDFAANGLYYNIEDFSIWDFVDGVATSARGA